MNRTPSSARTVAFGKLPSRRSVVAGAEGPRRRRSSTMRRSTLGRVVFNNGPPPPELTNSARRKTLLDIAVNAEAEELAVYQYDSRRAPILEAQNYTTLLFSFLLRAWLSVGFFLEEAIFCGLIAWVNVWDAGESSDLFQEKFGASGVTLGFFSAFVSFSLVFRTQVCYSRWWEGRCLWGALIFASLNLAQQGRWWFQDEENFRRLCCAIVSFSFNSKCQLRGEILTNNVDDDLSDDTKYLLERGLLNENELEALMERQGWQPYYFLGAMRESINNDLEQSRQVHHSEGGYSYRGSTAESQILIFEDSLKQLAKCIGGLIRVKATGLPVGYDFLFHTVRFTFFALASLAWAGKLGWYAVLVVTILNLVIRLIVCLGTSMEDPFSDDLPDLPLQKFCLAIETQVEAIFQDKFNGDEIGGGWPFEDGGGKHPTMETIQETINSMQLSMEEEIIFEEGEQEDTNSSTGLDFVA